MSVADDPSTRTAADWSGLRAWPVRRPALVVLLRGMVVLFVVWSAAGLLFTHLLDDGALGDADRALPRWLEERRTPTINAMSHWGEMLAETFVKTALVVIVGTVLVVVWRRWHDAVLLAASVVMEATVFLFSSLVVERDRPPVAQLDPIPPSGSFPSGHAGAAAAFYTALCVVVFWHTRRRAIRVGFVCLAVVAPVIVGLSRIARGMHHPVDVVAGILLGLACVYVVWRALRAGVRHIDDRVAAGELDVPQSAQRLDLTEKVAPRAGDASGGERLSGGQPLLRRGSFP